MLPQPGPPRRPARSGPGARRETAHCCLDQGANPRKSLMTDVLTLVQPATESDSCGIRACRGIRRAACPTTQTSPTTICAPRSAWVSAKSGNEPWSTPPFPHPGPKPGRVSRFEAGSSWRPTDGQRRRLRVRMASSRRRRAGRTDLELVANHQLAEAAAGWLAARLVPVGPRRGTHGPWPVGYRTFH